MLNFLLKVVRKLLSFHYGKAEYQAFFKDVARMGMKGMNYGFPDDFEKNGEASAIRYVKQKLNNQGVIFDVGANLGQYADKILQEFTGNVQLHCFEPSLKTYNSLLHSIKDQRVVFNRFGFGSKQEIKILYSSSTYSGLSSVFDRDLKHCNLELDVQESIEIKTIDGYCEENSITKIDFLKLDIEGNELNALNGAQRLLANNKIRFIQFEFGGCNIDSKVFFKNFWDLLSDNYKISRIVQDGFEPIQSYNEHNEIFLATNYFAELKS